MVMIESVLLLLAAVLISAVLDQVVPKVSSPLIQIALGLIIALFASDYIQISFDSDIFMLLFIAPLLYDEARHTNKQMLFSNLGSILSLAIGLVIATTLAIGYSLNLLIPSIPLAAAFALGAALGPTDAIAVSTLPKDVDLGDRRNNWLRGEYLLNDASGIVSFQFAIAAVTTGTFSIENATVTFILEFIGGLLVGLILGLLANAILRWVRQLGLANVTFHVLFDIFTPFIIYLAAQTLNTSGIIAVVVAGLARSITINEIGPHTSRLNLVSDSVWRVIGFALNGIVFVLMGTQLPRALNDTWDGINIGNFELLGYVIIIVCLVMVIRFIWLLFSEKRSHREEKRKFFDKKSIYSAVLLTLAGPKGAVTLAIVFTIPLTADGAPFPQRDLLIFLACGVILITLLISNFVMPAVAPKVDKQKKDEELHLQDVTTEMDILRLVIEDLIAHQTSDNKRATQSVIHSYNKRLERLKDFHDIDSDYNVELRVRAIKWQRSYVEQLLKQGKVDPNVAYRYLDDLSTTENVLTNHTDFFSLYIRLRRAITASRTAFHNFLNRLPGVSPAESIVALRALKAETLEHTIKLLKEEIEGETPSEDVSRLILDYQNQITSLKSIAPRISIITRSGEKINAIKRKAYNLEYEGIENAYDEGRLSRKAAQKMRRNVTLMLIDLDSLD